MDSTGNIVGKFIEGSKKTKELGEAGGDGYGDYSVPDEKFDNGVSSDVAFFPGDSRMCEVCNDGGDGSGNKIREPDKIIVLNDEIGQNCEKSIVEVGD